jgi:hypothetical protein
MLVIPGEVTFDEIIKKIEAHRVLLDNKAKEFAAAVKVQVASGDATLPSRKIEQLVKEQELLQEQFDQLLRTFQSATGISEQEIEAIEKAEQAKKLPRGDELWHDEVLQTRPTEDLDDLLDVGLENLLRLIDPQWLRAEAQKPYRLGADFLKNPLHLVSGVRIAGESSVPGPSRFARMLLLCLDHQNRQLELDFFTASSFASEIAMLGNSLKEIDELGPEATRKLAMLGSMPDDVVTSTIFELLVGAACVRRGLSVSMVPENRAAKVPDFRISGLGPFEGAIECKRRLGLTRYEIAEALSVEVLFDGIRGALRDRGIHGSIEAKFTAEIRTVDRADFVEQVLKVVNCGPDQEPLLTTWGSLSFHLLHRFKTIIDTRLYSPDFLESAFEWKPDEDEWDGLLCEVESPTQIGVSSFRSPICLKWRSESQTALTKKSRGVLSLWADAMKQIPAGDIGFVYVAYPEGSRPAVADARTREILKSFHEAWHHWSVRVPVTVVTRLYPRALGSGRPDLIENAVVGATEGQEFWVTKLPWMIFTHQFESGDD